LIRAWWRPLGGRWRGLRDARDQHRSAAATCTHKPDALLAESLLFRGAIMCSWHGYRYDVTTGRNVHPGNARPLARVPVRVDGEDLLLELT